jgi:hypothetical protein
MQQTPFRVLRHEACDVPHCCGALAGRAGGAEVEQDVPLGTAVAPGCPVLDRQEKTVAETDLIHATERQNNLETSCSSSLSVDDHAMQKFNGGHGLPTGAMADLLPTRHSTGDDHGVR